MVCSKIDIACVKKFDIFDYFFCVKFSGDDCFDQAQVDLNAVKNLNTPLYCTKFSDVIFKLTAVLQTLNISSQNTIQLDS